MIEALAERMVASCRARGETPPSEIQVMKHGDVPYPHPASPLVFFLFAGRCARPRAVAKVARIAAGDAAVETEAAGLARVRAALPADLALAVPDLLDAGRLDGRAFLLTTALDGTPEPHHAWTPRQAQRACSRIGAALEFATRLANALPAEPIAARTWLGSLDEVSAALGRAGLDPHARDALAARLAPAWSHPWPAGAAHGDFFPGNALFGRRDRIAVVDWATFAERAPVFVDPLAYESSFALQALHDRGRIDADAARAIHALPPFRAARARLAARGIDFERGAPARLLGCAAAALRELRAGDDRLDSARRWLALLEFERSFPDR